MNFIILLRQFNEMKDQIRALEERFALLETRQNPDQYISELSPDPTVDVQPVILRRGPGRPRKVDG